MIRNHPVFPSLTFIVLRCTVNCLEIVSVYLATQHCLLNAAWTRGGRGGLTWTERRGGGSWEGKGWAGQGPCIFPWGLLCVGSPQGTQQPGSLPSTLSG